MCLYNLQQIKKRGFCVWCYIFSAVSNRDTCFIFNAKLLPTGSVLIFQAQKIVQI